MSPQWTKLDTPPRPAVGPVYLDALLTPNRSLSRKTFILVITVFAVLNAIIATMFVLNGAYPVAGFLGLDVALLVWAFVWNYRDGRAHERVLVAGDRLHVQRQPVKGGADHWVVHPTWARVASEEDAVQIRAGGRTVSVAAFLSPDEREDFARALSEALVKARTERFGGKAL